MRRTEKDHLNLLSHIPMKRDGAVHMADLSAQLGVDDRTIRAWINSARNAGYIILSGNFGYCQSNDPSEIKRSHNRRCRMAASIYRSEKSTGEVLKETRGQLSMFDEDPGMRTEKSDGTEATAKT